MKHDGLQISNAIQPGLPLTFMAAVLILFLLLAFSACRENETPESTIDDGAKVLTGPQKDSLYSIMDALGKELGSSVTIVTVENLHGESIEKFSMDQAEELGLRDEAESNNGVLITLALQEKKVRIEVGTGLQDLLREEVAYHIISEKMIPACGQGKYGLAFYRGMDAIATIVQANPGRVGKKQ